MMYLTIIAALIILIYTAAMCVRNNGIPASLSQTAYLLTKKEQWLFGAVMISAGVLLSIVMIDKSTENTQFLGFLTMVGLYGVGVTPLFNPETLKAHYVFAVLSAVASSFLIILNSPLCAIPWFGYVFYTLLREDGKEVFWAEAANFIVILLYCLI